jgi:hypothetical protein
VTDDDAASRRGARVIPDRVVEFLHGPVYIQIGSRDAALRPAHTTAVGAVVHDDRVTVTVFVPTARAERLLRDLKENGRIAIGAGYVSHEAYQLKGTYISSRPTDDAERAHQEAYLAARYRCALEAGYPEALARPFCLGFAHAPGVAITFRTEEVFLQTPGPGAGTRLA